MDLWDVQLERDLGRTILVDRFRLRRRLDQLRRDLHRGRDVLLAAEQWREAVDRSVARREARWQRRPAVAFDESLPIAAHRQQIAQLLAAHQVLVVCGETGSGKSTQLPKICLELGRGIDGLIGHTQPRRIAARSVAARIADELGTPLGAAVGYKIRFQDVTRAETYVKLMTDGILLAETQHDRFLDQYDTIIIDEAHERSLNIDFLLGLLARVLPRRPELKLLITSATIDAARFAAHFAEHRAPASGGGPLPPVPVVEVAGRTFPVEVRYCPPTTLGTDLELDLPQAVVSGLEQLADLPLGDVLVFLPTERDIHETVKVLRGHPAARRGDTELLPLYARLSTREQQRIFQPHAGRRIVLATNVAESSLTVPGIRYVIDTGLARISRYAARSKVQRLPVEPISQASADQRAGRCGRVAPGVCIRLYSEDDYRHRERYTTPEIRRTHLAAAVLQTKSLGLGPLEMLPLLDPPHSDMVRDGYQTLFELGALDEQNDLTPIGQMLARMPIDPRIGRMILAAHHEGCLRDMLIIAAALEIQDPRERPPEHADAADTAHARYTHAQSDFIGLVKLWDFFQQLKATFTRSQLRKACQRNFLSYNRLREWSDIHRQLLALTRQDLLRKPSAQEPSDKQRYAALHRSILTGLLSGVAWRRDAFEYVGAGGVTFVLWPGSGPFVSKPNWIVAAEIIETTRRYARLVASIDPQWIDRLAGHLLEYTYSDPQWYPKAGTVLATERAILYGLVVTKKRVPYGPIDPVAARELFIHDALVGGALELDAPFLRHNQQLRDDLARQAAKARRTDLVVNQRTCRDFYQRVLPADVYDVKTLQHWRRTIERTEPRRLFMSREDLVGTTPPPVDETGFPESLTVNEQLELPLEYRFEPGMNDDGITLVVPRDVLPQLTAARTDWLIPGLLTDKIERLIRSLPKSLRRELPPAEDAARRVAEQLRYGEGPLLASVAAVLCQISGRSIRPDQFQLDKLPHYFSMHVRVVGEQGQVLAEGRDVDQLRRKLGVRPQAVREIVEPGWRQDGVVAWIWETLPEELTLTRAGISLPAFPTLLDRGNSVALRLLDSRDEARRAFRRGVRRLYFLAERPAIREHLEWLPNRERWYEQLRPRIRPELLLQQLGDLIADRAFLGEAPTPRTAAEFDARLEAGRRQLEEAVVAIVQLLGPLAQSFDELRRTLDTYGSGPVPEAVSDVRRQLDRLFVRDFFTETPWRWLSEFPRYLAGARIRLERLSGNLARDRESQAELQQLWQQYDERATQLREVGRFDRELETYRWMLEEYRVSLLAQTIGTSITISPQRLVRQWERVG